MKYKGRRSYVFSIILSPAFFVHNGFLRALPILAILGMVSLVLVLIILNNNPVLVFQYLSIATRLKQQELQINN